MREYRSRLSKGMRRLDAEPSRRGASALPMAGRRQRSIPLIPLHSSALRGLSVRWTCFQKRQIRSPWDKATTSACGLYPDPLKMRELVVIGLVASRRSGPIWIPPRYPGGTLGQVPLLASEDRQFEEGPPCAAEGLKSPNHGPRKKFGVRTGDSPFEKETRLSLGLYLSGFICWLLETR